MSTFKEVLRSRPKEQKLAGMAFIALGLIGFFFAMDYLGLFNSAIEYSPSYIGREVIAFSFIIFAMYGAGYVLGGNRAGFQWVKFWALFLLAAEVIGYLGHEYIPTIQPFFGLILFLLFIAWSIYSRRKKA